MKNGVLIKNTDVIIYTGISSFTIIFTIYLWAFVNGENHWELFGTEFEQFLTRYNKLIPFLFSFPLIIPFIRKRNVTRLIIAIF